MRDIEREVSRSEQAFAAEKPIPQNPEQTVPKAAAKASYFQGTIEMSSCNIEQFIAGSEAKRLKTTRVSNTLFLRRNQKYRVRHKSCRFRIEDF